jgi:UDP-N-acetylmuramyl pentapeptide phosphotransferase/UDP-N-acetylglucosamine-1-phosphate transferase
VCFAANAWNTFDNADGVATGLGAIGLASGGAAGAGAALGFLPWNLARPRSAPGAAAPPRPPSVGSTGAECAGRTPIPAPPEGRRQAPVAYLGDSGSHLLGMLLLLTPGAWPVFLLPAADLARLSVVRLRRGRAPWQGDRRHLAHRLEKAGLGRLGVLAVLLGLGAIPLAWRGAGGLLAGLAAFALAVALTPDPDAGPR